jgi:hypothetical protein
MAVGPSWIGLPRVHRPGSLLFQLKNKSKNLRKISILHLSPWILINSETTLHFTSRLLNFTQITFSLLVFTQRPSNFPVFANKPLVLPILQFSPYILQQAYLFNHNSKFHDFYVKILRITSSFIIFIHNICFFFAF